MKINGYEVVRVSDDVVKIGCTTVSRSEVEQVMEILNKKPLKFRIVGASSPVRQAGDVWLQEEYGSIRLCYQSGDYENRGTKGSHRDGEAADFE